MDMENILSDTDRVLVKSVRVVDRMELCYVIEHKRQPPDEHLVTSQWFGIEMGFQIPNGTENSWTDIYFTSRDNAMGVVGGAWRDGRVDRYGHYHVLK